MSSAKCIHVLVISIHMYANLVFTIFLFFVVGIFLWLMLHIFLILFYFYLCWTACILFQAAFFGVLLPDCGYVNVLRTKLLTRIIVLDWSKQFLCTKVCFFNMEYESLSAMSLDFLLWADWNWVVVNVRKWKTFSLPL